jgi:small subunit ribosomal protein S2
MVKMIKEEKKDNGGINKELEEMLAAGVHFGYSRQSRHPKMKLYLFGVRSSVEIFDLEKTRTCLEKAKEFLGILAKEDKKILLVSTKPGIRQLIEEAGKDLKMPYVSERWLGGILTNFKNIKERLDYFLDLRKKKETGELHKYTKKEISRFNKELSRLSRFLGSLELLDSLPSAIIIIDPKKEKTALRESFQMSIPVVAILNSDSDPTGIKYPIPANDTSLTSVKFLLNQLVDAYKNKK